VDDIKKGRRIKCEMAWTDLTVSRQARTSCFADHQLRSIKSWSGFVKPSGFKKELKSFFYFSSNLSVIALCLILLGNSAVVRFELSAKISWRQCELCCGRNCPQAELLTFFVRRNVSLYVIILKILF